MKPMISGNQYKKYMPLLVNYPKGEAEQILQKVISAFGRHDRIIWALREFRFKALMRKTPSTLTNKEKKHIRKHRHQNGKMLSDYNLYSFIHYLSQNIYFINKVNFGRETIQEILAKLEAAESTYLTRIKCKDMYLKPSGKLITNVTPTLAWWDLQTPYSKEEGISGRTCGNSHYTTGDTILSLREKHIIDGEELWQTKLTFIYNARGAYMGEMKGRANTKPNAVYHDAIIELFRHLPDLIELRGARHNNADDFSISDLSDEHKARLIATRPDLLNINVIDLKKHPLALRAYNNLSAERVHSCKDNKDLILADHITRHTAETHDVLSLELMKAVFSRGSHYKQANHNERDSKLCIKRFLASRLTGQDLPRIYIASKFTSSLFLAYLDAPKEDAIEDICSVLYCTLVQQKEHKDTLFFTAKHYPEALKLLQCAA